MVFGTKRGFARLRTIILTLGAMTLAGCAGALNAVTSTAGYVRVDDVRYMSGPRGVLDLYIPDDAGPRTPIVVFIHGGSWDTGDKSMYPFVGQSLASEGVIVAIPNYRLYPEVVFPGFVEDAARAATAVEAMGRSGANGIPAGRHPFVLMGHSAGAEIAGLLATDRRYLAQAGGSIGDLDGFVGLAGPYDFLPLTEERYKQIFPAPTRDASQPVNFVDGDEPPMLLIAGSSDTTVDPQNTRSLASRARSAGIPVRERIVEGVDHVGAITAFATALRLSDRSIRRDVLDFIRQRGR